MSETRSNQLEVTREKMIKCAIEKGILNNETIKLSEELDQLLNDFQYTDMSDTETKIEG
ncbi:Spo0E like sporulation regulatory protein [Psychrobacillus psychrotolerans]|uniref:Spo0E like sporulation regulatory protein n=1 Tax=Psychrobacillus psychrotolerans TaxID=126156 RepID=A0A1I5WSS1_9BACI|nr:aspartyl-phosphate phosphatase Spo0E family protein [Psychrobacillus psychrotolerans]SFQ22608.1 Spo0E like sporulation regulatory protein [Psychrobacillus psychrotolerans]